MKKLLFVHSSLKRGGAERTLVRIGEQLLAGGYEVGLFLSSPEEGTTNYAPPAGLKIASLKSNASGVRKYLAVLSALRAHVRAEKPDVVIALNSSQAVDILLACAFLKVKKVACERANPYLSMKGTVWYRLKRIASRFMDGYVFQTKRAAAFYPKSVQRRMVVIPNMVDTVSENRYELGRKVILTVGNLRAVKGHRVLVDAFAALDAPDYQLILCGEGACRSELEEQIRSLSLSERVTLAGNVDNVADYYERAGIFVLSSFHEGMPNALAEAMSHGLPCVSTDCPMGPRELIRDGESGLLCEVGNAASLTAAMQKLIDSPALCKTLSDNAFCINETNAPERIGKEWEAYLKRIAQGTRDFVQNKG